VRRYIPAIVVAGLFVLGIIGCVCYALYADTNCLVDNEAKYPRWLTKAFCEARFADIALAYFAYGLIIVTGYLAWATLKLWTATIEADRPWVGTLTVGPDRDRNPLGAEIVIRNTGRRPALQMRVAHRGVLLDQGTVPAIPDPRNEVSKALFPNADDFYYPLHGRPPFTDAESHGIETGTHVLWVIARIEYLDGWGNTHHTNICTRWDRHRGTFVPDLNNEAN
jgi:hypothetical protein